MLRAVRKTSVETGTTRIQKRRKNPKPTVNATTKVPDARRLKISDSVIEQIMQAMKIPAEEWDPAVYKVSSAVESCIESFIDGRLGEHESRYEMITSLCDQLRRELSNLNNSERRHLSANLQDFERSLGEIESTALYLRPTWRPRHRPRDSVKYPHIRDLIYDLDNIAGVHGAELTFYLDDDKKKGSAQHRATVAISFLWPGRVTEPQTREVDRLVAATRTALATAATCAICFLFSFLDSYFHPLPTSQSRLVRILGRSQV